MYRILPFYPEPWDFPATSKFTSIPRSEIRRFPEVVAGYRDNPEERANTLVFEPCVRFCSQLSASAHSNGGAGGRNQLVKSDSQRYLASRLWPPPYRPTFICHGVQSKYPTSYCVRPADTCDLSQVNQACVPVLRQKYSSVNSRLNWAGSSIRSNRIIDRVWSMSASVC